MLHDQAFADDISFVSSSPGKMQTTIDVFAAVLTRAPTSQASKLNCVCFAMKKFGPRIEHKVDYKRFGSTVYCPFDPNLMIAGKKLRFIVSTDADPDSLQ